LEALLPVKSGQILTLNRSTTSWRGLWKWCRRISRTSRSCSTPMSTSLRPLGSRKIHRNNHWWSSQKEIEKRVESINDIIQRLRKLEAEISRETTMNVSTGINYNDLESQPTVPRL
jgi:hypothetical protein